MDRGRPRAEGCRPRRRTGWPAGPARPGPDCSERSPPTRPAARLTTRIARGPTTPSTGSEVERWPATAGRGGPLDPKSSTTNRTAPTRAACCHLDRLVGAGHLAGVEHPGGETGDGLRLGFEGVQPVGIAGKGAGVGQGRQRPAPPGVLQPLPQVGPQPGVAPRLEAPDLTVAAPAPALHPATGPPQPGRPTNRQSERPHQVGSIARSPLQDPGDRLPEHVQDGHRNDPEQVEPP